MKHDALKKFLHFSLNQRINGTPISPIVWSTTGVGKTHTVKEFAKEIGASLTILHLSSQEPGDLIGLPTRDEEKGITKWLKPEWFPTDDAAHTDKLHLVFLDEFNRCHKSIMDIMLPFLLDGEIHTHKVPRNTLIVAAANPDDGEGYNVTSIDDKALLSRLCHIRLDSNFDSWKEFCSEDVDEAMIRIAEKSGKFGGGCVIPEIEPDPRSMYLAGKAIKDISDEDFQLFGVEFLVGMIGPMGYAVYDEKKNAKANEDAVSIKEVIDNYDSVRDKVIALRNEKFTSMTELSSSLFNEICSNGSDFNKCNIDNIANFLLDLPEEPLTGFWVKLIKTISTNEDESTIRNILSEFNDSISENSDLVNRISSITCKSG